MVAVSEFRSTAANKNFASFLLALRFTITCEPSDRSAVARELKAPVKAAHPVSCMHGQRGACDGSSDFGEERAMVVLRIHIARIEDR
jgi:hypothetical protein